MKTYSVVSPSKLISLPRDIWRSVSTYMRTDDRSSLTLAGLPNSAGNGRLDLKFSDAQQFFAFLKTFSNRQRKEKATVKQPQHAEPAPHFHSSSRSQVGEEGDGDEGEDSDGNGRAETEENTLRNVEKITIFENKYCMRSYRVYKQYRQIKRYFSLRNVKQLVFWNMKWYRREDHTGNSATDVVPTVEVDMEIESSCQAGSAVGTDVSTSASGLGLSLEQNLVFILDNFDGLKSLEIDSLKATSHVFFDRLNAVPPASSGGTVSSSCLISLWLGEVYTFVELKITSKQLKHLFLKNKGMKDIRIERAKSLQLLVTEDVFGTRTDIKALEQLKYLRVDISSYQQQKRLMSQLVKHSLLGSLCQDSAVQETCMLLEELHLCFKKGYRSQTSNKFESGGMVGGMEIEQQSHPVEGAGHPLNTESEMEADQEDGESQGDHLASSLDGDNIAEAKKRIDPVLDLSKLTHLRYLKVENVSSKVVLPPGLVMVELSWTGTLDDLVFSLKSLPDSLKALHLTLPFTADVFRTRQDEPDSTEGESLLQVLRKHEYSLKALSIKLPNLFYPQEAVFKQSFPYLLALTIWPKQRAHGLMSYEQWMQMRKPVLYRSTYKEFF